VPAQAIASGDLILAIRFACSPVGRDGPGTSSPIYGDSSVSLNSPFAYGVMADSITAKHTIASVIVAALALLIAIVAFSLGAALRDRSEYIAAGVYLLATAAQGASGEWNSNWTDTTFTHILLTVFCAALRMSP
jgi:hypothetical protein